MRIRAIHLSIVAAVLIALWWRFTGPSGDSSPSTPDVDRAPVAQGTVDPLLLSSTAESDPMFDHLPRRALEEYQQFAVYPPWSRPATPAYANNIAWNPPMSTIELSIGPNGQVETEGGDQGLPRYTQRLAFDRLFAGPDEALTATLTVRRDTGARVAFTALGQVQVFDESLEEEHGYRAAWETVGSVAFSDAPTDSTIKLARFVPSRIPALATAPSRARLVVRVEVDGFKPSLITEEFQYAARAPFVVIDKVADRVAEGSLEIEFDVDVRHVRPVAVFALLSNAKGNVAIYDGFFRPTKTGRQPMRITFFGKAIRDAAADGPYEVSALHGQVKLQPDDETFVWWGDQRKFSTRDYRAADFSGDEWQSPEKTEQIERMEQVLAHIESNPP